MITNPNIFGAGVFRRLISPDFSCYHGGVNWTVYIIHCSDNSLYTGITLDIGRRLSEHAGKRRAKYFRGRRPGEVVYLEGGHTRSTASRREAAIKRLRRIDKLKLIASKSNEL
jgi:putative endonuclease